MKLISTTTYQPPLSIEWHVKTRAEIRAGLPPINHNRTMLMRKEEAEAFVEILRGLEENPAAARRRVTDRWVFEVVA